MATSVAPDLLASIASAAEKPVADAISAAGPALTRTAAEKIVEQTLAQSTPSIMKRYGPKVEFELLNGKLKIGSHAGWGPVKVGSAEVNLYQKVPLVAGMLMVCYHNRQDGHYQACVGKSLKALYMEGKGPEREEPKPVRGPDPVGHCLRVARPGGPCWNGA
jgi:hypothetical protein